MTKEEAVEGIKRHAEAILAIAKEIGTEDYLSMAIVNGRISVDNQPKHSGEDGLGIDLYYAYDGEWRIWH